MMSRPQILGKQWLMEKVINQGIKLTIFVMNTEWLPNGFSDYYGRGTSFGVRL